jgi:hypothetical protein
VANNLSIPTLAAKPNDTDIARAAANAPEANVHVPADQIDVTVNNGKSTLTGAVDWAYERDAAANTVRFLKSVRDVIILVTVRQPTVSVLEVEAGIEGRSSGWPRSMQTASACTSTAARFG